MDSDLGNVRNVRYVRPLFANHISGKRPADQRVDALVQAQMRIMSGSLRSGYYA